MIAWGGNKSSLLLGAGGLLVLVLALPSLIQSRFIIDVMTMIMFSAFLGQSWNILGGYAGQFSFGGVVFFGTGASVSNSTGHFLPKGAVIWRVPLGATSVSHIQDSANGRISITRMD